NIDLHLRHPQPTVKKLDRGLKTMRRGLSFVAHYLDQKGYCLDRMAGRFKPSSILLLGQFSRTAAWVRGNAWEPIGIACLAHFRSAICSQIELHLARMGTDDVHGRCF